ncbi:MAG: hypothetical protein K5910_07315 [Bacteroidales bacterium]|nr:hypothetical protein [Bacteroidales bacterium]
MKKISVLLLLLLAGTFFSSAQTAGEIISRMEQVLSESTTNTVALTMDLKMPVVGTMTTRSYVIGDKARIEGEIAGEKAITWTDGQTKWVYDVQKNEVEISKDDTASSDSKQEGDISMFDDITDGYDVSIKQETASAWHILCRKSRSNPDKDAPKTMDLVVAKGTYLPVSLSAKVSFMTMTMRDFSFDVTEDMVTFRQEDFPGVTVVDKR